MGELELELTYADVVVSYKAVTSSSEGKKTQSQPVNGIAAEETQVESVHTLNPSSPQLTYASTLYSITADVPLSVDINVASNVDEKSQTQIKREPKQILGCQTPNAVDETQVRDAVMESTLDDGDADLDDTIRTAKSPIHSKEGGGDTDTLEDKEIVKDTEINEGAQLQTRDQTV